MGDNKISEAVMVYFKRKGSANEDRIPALSVESCCVDPELITRVVPLNLQGEAVPVVWRSMESAPKDGTAVFGMLKGSDIPQAIRFRGGWEIAWDGYRIPAHDGPTRWRALETQPAELNEVSGNSGELGGDAPGITDKWVLEYLDTDAPESSREAIRNAFAEWNSLADNGALRGGRITGWAMVDGVRVFSASSHSGILDDQQFVRYDDHLAALAATGKRQVVEVQGIDMGQKLRALELMRGVARTLVDWAADDQREAIKIIEAMSGQRDAGTGVDDGN